MIVKKGDYLFCKKSIEGKYTENKRYIVCDVRMLFGVDPYTFDESNKTKLQFIRNRTVCIKNDYGLEDHFGDIVCPDFLAESLVKFFYTEQEYRDKKLKDILDQQN